MRHEKTYIRPNGDAVTIVTMITASVFVSQGYEVEQFLLVKLAESEESFSVHHQWAPKTLSRQEYMEEHRPKGFWGYVSNAESLKAGIEAREQFFS